MCDWDNVQRPDAFMRCFENMGTAGRVVPDFVYLLTNGNVKRYIDTETFAGNAAGCYEIRYVWMLAPQSGKLCVSSDLGVPLFLEMPWTPRDSRPSMLSGPLLLTGGQFGVGLAHRPRRGGQRLGLFRQRRVRAVALRCRVGLFAGECLHFVAQVLQLPFRLDLFLAACAVLARMSRHGDQHANPDDGEQEGGKVEAATGWFAHEPIITEHDAGSEPGRASCIQAFDTRACT